MSSNNNFEYQPGGISGPRRTTQEPLETAAANAEATRLAEELGVSSSVRLTSVRREEISPSSTSSSKKKKGFKLFARSSSAGEDAKDYQAVPADGSTAGLGLLNKPGVNPTASVTTGAATLAPAGAIPFGASHTMPDGMEPPLITITEKNKQEHDDDITVRKEEPRMFDANGNRAPYREGPYDYHHDEDGRLIKKRWCK
jgi:hypothetical protein